MIRAYTIAEAFDVMRLYRDFLDRDPDGTGTVVMHHGRVKRPGKQIADFRWVDLEPVMEAVDPQLMNLAEDVARRYELNQVLLVHRLGRISARDTVLLAIVSGKTRDRCFDACRVLVDEVKKEEWIRLVERGEGD